MIKENKVQSTKTKSKRKYQKPELKSEKILDAGLGATCNGTTNGGRKSATPACTASSLKT